MYDWKGLICLFKLRAFHKSICSVLLVVLVSYAGIRMFDYDQPPGIADPLVELRQW